MPIQDLAREDVVSTERESPVPELARLMREENVGSVVVTDDDRAVGIVTDRDLTTRTIAEGLDPDELTAEDVMSADLCTVDPDAGFYEAAEVMQEHEVRRLPVCADDGELRGIITVDDLTELLAEENDHLASVIRAQRPEY